MEKLTGKTRYRGLVKGVFKKKTLLVLQVEVAGVATHYGTEPMDYKEYDYTRWKDATIADIKEVKFKTGE